MELMPLALASSSHVFPTSSTVLSQTSNSYWLFSPLASPQGNWSGLMKWDTEVQARSTPTTTGLSTGSEDFSSVCIKRLDLSVITLQHIGVKHGP
jgi:hypothetical protein